MNSAYGNTRLARGLVWTCAIADVLAFFLMCEASSSVNSPGVVGWLLVGAGFLVGNVVTAAYAIQQGLPFAWLIERKWKKTCAGLGGKFVGEGRAKFHTKVAFDPLTSIQKGEWKRDKIYPKIRHVYGSRDGFTAVITPFYGQNLDDYTKQADRFAMAFHTVQVAFDLAENGLIRMRAGKVPVPAAYGHPGALQTHHAANSTRVIAPAVSFVPSVNAHYQQVDYRQANVWAYELALLQGVPICRDIEGKTVCLPIEEQHWFIAAATGGGKGSWIWSLVLGLEPAWRVGLVKFWGCDPKRLELAIAGRDFWEYEHYADNEADIVDMLEQCVSEMLERAKSLQGKARKFTVTVATPLNVVVVDEMGYLSALLPDRKLRDRAEKAVSTILALGRAVGYSLVGAVQDPRKETCGFRDLFPIRIAGRLNAPMVDLVLGEGAYEAGALCDQIPMLKAGAGVAYVLDETSMKPRLVRAAWCSDDDIQGMLAGVPAQPEPLKPVTGAQAVKDEEPAPQPGLDSQPLQQWQYRVE